MESRLMSKASEEGVDRAIIIAYTIVSLDLALFKRNWSRFNVLVDEVKRPIPIDNISYKLMLSV